MYRIEYKQHKPRTACRLIASLIALMIVGLPSATQAQSTISNGLSEPAPQALFNQRELEQMLAPVALYPDALLAQVLMASTYPLEIVQAARWSRANPSLRGEAAVAAVTDKPWDPSVKSLIAFPDLLASMDENLEHTQAIGDAFLAQKDQVMDTVQFLRRKAQEAGNLASNKQQLVTTEAQTIIIQPAAPDVVYVPYYNPTVVYGSWWWPTYQPYYYAAPAGYSFASGFAFGAGVVASTAIFGSFNWGRRDIYINTNRYNTLNPYYPRAQSNIWRHDPIHRGGVYYRDFGSRERYRNMPGPGPNRYREPGHQGGFTPRPPPGNWDSGRPPGNNRPPPNRPEHRPSAVPGFPNSVGDGGAAPIPYRNETDTRNTRQPVRPSAAPAPSRPSNWSYRAPAVPQQNNPPPVHTPTPTPSLGSPGDSSGPIPYRNESGGRGAYRYNQPAMNQPTIAAPAGRPQPNVAAPRQAPAMRGMGGMGGMGGGMSMGAPSGPGGRGAGPSPRSSLPGPGDGADPIPMGNRGPNR